MNRRSIRNQKVLFLSTLCGAILLTRTAGYAQGKASIPPMAHEPNCTTIATDHKPVDCIIYRPVYFKGPDGHTVMGVCIYLGVNIPPFYANLPFLHYNWIQQFKNNSDTVKQCGDGTVHTDPCPSQDPLYRSRFDMFRFTGDAARRWGVSHIFRDMPSRDVTAMTSASLNPSAPLVAGPGVFYWKSTVSFVRVRAYGSDSDYVPVESATYGFTIDLKASVLKLDPLVIDGRQVAAGQTRSLKDTPDKYETSAHPSNVCIPYDVYRNHLEDSPFAAGGSENQ